LLLIFSLISIITANTPSLFQEWKQTHGKDYLHYEEDYARYSIWKSNYDYIEKHNELFSQGLTTFTLAMNQFGDLTNDEFVEYLKAYSKQGEMIESEILDVNIPDRFDWGDKKVVPNVGDQGQCGASTLYAESHDVESIYAIANGKLLNINIYQIAACLAEGCNGVYLYEAYQYLIKCGIPTGTYDIGTPCNYDPKKALPIINGYTVIPKGNEGALAQSLFSNGPHSVAVDASHSSFQFYSSGIYYEAHCSTTELDHEMLLIGYGITGNDKFWIVQNSWGTGWGSNGYINMSRDRNNNCGIATSAAVSSLGNNTFNPDDFCYGKH